MRDEQVEQYAFVLLAEAAKIFEDQGTNVDWKFALMTAGLALENGRLSESLKPEEAASLYKESGPQILKSQYIEQCRSLLTQCRSLLTLVSVHKFSKASIQSR